jgi:threonine aldolase
MDGARFANALVGQNASPADLTWKAGVDVLCLGATKNGALAAEAIVVFDLTLAETMPFRRMRGGHLLSKGRFIGAQMEAWLADDHWRDLARHANAMARRLADGLRSVPGVRLPWPVDGNEVFAILPEALEQRVKARGLQFHRWRQDSVTGAAAVRPGEVLCRLVASFQTTRELVDEGLARFKAA